MGIKKWKLKYRIKNQLGTEDCEVKYSEKEIKLTKYFEHGIGAGGLGLKRQLGTKEVKV